MFKNEIKAKFRLKDELFPFALNMLGRSKLVVSGVKRVVEANEKNIKIRVENEYLDIAGVGLFIAEIGGGDVYVEGKIESIAFEKE